MFKRTLKINLNSVSKYYIIKDTSVKTFFIPTDQGYQRFVFQNLQKSSGTHSKTPSTYKKYNVPFSSNVYVF